MRFDVVIGGAGPVGLCLARALAEQGRRVAVVDRHPRAALEAPAFDGREIALTHASRQLLEALSVWPRLDAETISPLRQARVQDGVSPFALDIGAERGQDAPLGWLVANHRLRRAACEAALAHPGVTLLDSAGVAGLRRHPDQVEATLEDGLALHAELLVAADGRLSALRRQLGVGAELHELGRSMLVCHVAHEQADQGVALEWFAYGATLALLPLTGDVSSLVLTLTPQRAAAMLRLDEDAFSAEVTRLCEGRLGAMRLFSTRHVYPLVSTYARRLAGARFALAGDAAVGMHPVTAHGFNFGLGGVGRLAQALDGQDDAGALAPLQAYARAHRRATWPLYAATQLVARLYTDERPAARLLRGGALRLVAAVTPFRHALQQHLQR
ncbi:5-demethoxyubiquinol-8 5-hydroxylase UbiM [Pseudoxanthomonas sp. X-1]|uniref:5-demethoxyubiquinol-8 5-hydroxylase UbiM n=1 Tax=Pseudoxanthomonas sp. X-1 TaxID=2571115 RepID=UPI00110A9C25|nr:5-demethoxyubiquinol-8 5-hydroxylase UbiM [Pseudoxanthomonas sp. X-1]TMN24956.1 5-demethoxyubiquinol-8 5-hydroxylase UbiM [Pseudoxanthomonas sp. X-1]UAY73734.1 5-demethoxyubiquinol-8 5-hydroxylase UbiM [Pseudoxanthomonas sp. X-1]